MKTKWQLLILSALLILGINPGAVGAQQAGTKAPVVHDQVISLNPILLMWEWTNVEFERKISPLNTMGVVGSWISFDGGDEDYRSLNVFLRHYPQGAALTGFYVGGRAGIYSVDDDNNSATAFGTGVDVGYSWLMGAKRTFYLGMGIGATRLFGGDMEDFSATVPNVKLLNIGIAF